MRSESELRPEQMPDQQISWQAENVFGNFRVIEDENGVLHLDIENKEGVKVDLKKFIPSGYRVIGNKIVWEDSRYMGLYGTETSICDQDTKTIIISEKELKKYGWKYLLIFFHEIGHAVRDEQFPEKRKERNVIQFWTIEPETLKQMDRLMSEEERGAWAIGIKIFKQFVRETTFPVKELFPTVDSLKDFVKKASLEEKAMSSGQLIQNFKISESEKEKLWEEIIQMYLQGKS